MRIYVYVLMVVIFLCGGCKNDERNRQLDKKEAALLLKEQELETREKSLQFKEEEFTKKAAVPDTSLTGVDNDSLHVRYPSLPGTWNVTMRCIETTCAGSAVGDTKTEQWNLQFDNNGLVANAMSDNKLLRIYSGTLSGAAFELYARKENAAVEQAANIVVRLIPTNDNQMTGRREILRANDCRIIYSLDFRKQ